MATSPEGGRTKTTAPHPGLGAEHVQAQFIQNGRKTDFLKARQCNILGPGKLLEKAPKHRAL